MPRPMLPDRLPMRDPLTHFFDEATSTLSYLVADPSTLQCAAIDPALNLDSASATLSAASADEIVRHIRDRGLDLSLILMTHIHADQSFSAPRPFGWSLVSGQWDTRQ